MSGSVRQASTRFSIVTRSKGQSAVEKASYISRTEIFNEYDGVIYRPKYHEDLVHSEISLPENAPKEFADRAILWNSVERIEKGQKAQLARMMKASLPNEWSYELAEEILRDYVQRNFISKGMCADWAIHDSVNDKGERNLHFHLLLTIRPLEADGSWGTKQRKVYLLDEDGHKIKNKNGKGYKCTTEQTTDWNNRENAKMWRKDLADTINSVNEQIGLDVHWEHRSFEEQGLDILPTIHLGPKAAALEKKGIETDRGNINREIRKYNRGILDLARAFITNTGETLIENVKDVTSGFVNEVIDMINKVMERKGRLELPVVSGKFLAKVSGRSALQNGENAKRFVAENKIDSFEGLDKFRADKESEYSGMEKAALSRNQQIKRLKQKASLYYQFSGYREVYEKSRSLKGRAKVKYDREHRELLEAYPRIKDQLTKLLDEDEKLAPKQWNREVKALQGEYDKIRADEAGVITDLAFAEVLDYNRDNLDRELSNESRSKDRTRKTDRKKNEKNKDIDI